MNFFCTLFNLRYPECSHKYLVGWLSGRRGGGWREGRWEREVGFSFDVVKETETETEAGAGTETDRARERDRDSKREGERDERRREDKKD